MEIGLVLGFPLAGGLLLALTGHRRWAPELNALMSLGTLCAAALLVSRVITDGPLLSFDRQFFVDPFNVFLVALTAFVAFTTRPVYQAGAMLIIARRALVTDSVSIITEPTQRPSNAISLAYAWYGDYSRWTELLDLNPALPWPARIPEGMTLVRHGR